jgi:hypothetical protein
MYVQMKQMPEYSSDIIRFVNGVPARIPTIDNIGINRFASIARSDEMGGCSSGSSHFPTKNDPRLMSLQEYQEYVKHPQPIGLNAQLYGL